MTRKDLALIAIRAVELLLLAIAAVTGAIGTFASAASRWFTRAPMRKVVAPALLLLAACAGPSEVRVKFLGHAGWPPMPRERVEVVHGSIVGPYQPIASLEVEGDGSSQSELIERMRERAARIGANALIEVRPRWAQGVSGTWSATSTSHPERELGIVAGALVAMGLLASEPKLLSVTGLAVHRGDELTP